MKKIALKKVDVKIKDCRTCMQECSSPKIKIGMVHYCFGWSDKKVNENVELTF